MKTREPKDIHALIESLCNGRGISISNMGTELVTQYGENAYVSKAAISGWKKGSHPNIEKLKFIADFFEVTVDYLLGKEPAPVKMETELLRIFYDLPVVEQAQLLAFAVELKNKQEKSPGNAEAGGNL
jgi:transcriptional regulator with XRE-family HTH domain